VATRQRTPDAQAGPTIASRLLAGGTNGNELLTSLTGAVLIALLAVIGITILSLRSLLWVHLFVGLVLVGVGLVWSAGR